MGNTTRVLSSPFPYYSEGSKKARRTGELETPFLNKGSLTSTMALISPNSPHPELITDPNQPMEDDDTCTPHESSFGPSSCAMTTNSNPGSVVHSPMSRSHSAQFRVKMNPSRSSSPQHARYTTNQRELLKQQIRLAFQQISSSINQS